MRECFIGISKHREQSLKYDVQKSLFVEIRGVWIANETLSTVWYIFSFDTKTKEYTEK